MKTVIKSFCKQVSINSTEFETVELRDSSGVLLECTEVTVIPLSGGVDTGYFWVEPSSAGASTGYLGRVALSATTTDGSGAAGVGGKADTIVRLSLPDKNRIAAIKIHNSLGQTGVFIINYGNRKPANYLSSWDKLKDGN